jgi:hypothetical protein
MTIEAARTFLVWCTVINYAVLIVWFLAFVLAGNWLFGMHGRFFRLTREHFDALHYGGMAVYKIGILLFNVVPLVALALSAKAS